MGKSKGPRIFVTLECTNCRTNLVPRKPGVSRYLTSKNKRNTPSKLELVKFCKYCNKHIIHKEIK